MKNIGSISTIKKVHLELSSECNAACPQCPSTVNGYPHNRGFIKHSMSLNEAQAIFKPEFVQQLELININGNFGDFVMAPDALEIIKYFTFCNPSIQINVSTNGGARNTQFWRELAQTSDNLLVSFCIDGLEDTNHLYRQNVSWPRLMENVQAYIAAGGCAGWKYLIFDHNQHQIDDAKVLSEQMGFECFMPQNTVRSQGPVFNRHGEYTHSLGHSEPSTIESFINIPVVTPKPPSSIDPTVKIRCDADNYAEIYISSVGDVYPCCFLGFEPKTFKWHNGANHFDYSSKQIVDIVKDNNAIKYGLEHSIQWFTKVSSSWQQTKFEDGRLVACSFFALMEQINTIATVNGSRNAYC